jgi:cold-inducible RNA-binding protein
VSNQLYVGNLSYGMTGGILQNLFESHGSVRSSHIPIDRQTGRSKGFGLVEMDNPGEAQAALDNLNGHEVNGRALTVRVVRPREETFLGAPMEQFANNFFG